MKKAQLARLLFTHPNEFRSLIQYWLSHEPKRDITALSEHGTSGYDRKTMKRCWEFLDQTSRSFAAVIKELEGDLARVVCLFYLVLRGLDTLEDDMTLSDEAKQPLLRTFHQKLSTEGWTFDGCGEGEKDRQLLVEFDCVVTEMGHLDELCREVITDICFKMETGMADFAHRAATSTTAPYLTSIEEYDLYCHYVAGLVGEGLSRLFAATKKERPWIADQLVLSNSMGLLLQKTNILRDFREDCDEGRYFWPREIWGAYGFSRPEEMTAPGGEAQKRAMWALSHMTLNALGHTVDALDYLTMLRNQSVFNFVAIPATMAIATLALCFMNADVFQRNVKIRKGQAVKLIMSSNNPHAVAYIFRDYARVIHKKVVPADPNYLRICVACGKIEQWVEHHYPSFVSLAKGAGAGGVSLNPSDPRSRIVARERTLESEKRERAAANDGDGDGRANADADAVVANQPLTRREEDTGMLPWQLYLAVVGLLVVLLGGSLAIVFGVIWYLDQSSGAAAASGVVDVDL